MLKKYYEEITTLLNSLGAEHEEELYAGHLINKEKFIQKAFTGKFHRLAGYHIGHIQEKFRSQYLPKYFNLSPKDLENWNDEDKDFPLSDNLRIASSALYAVTYYFAGVRTSPLPEYFTSKEYMKAEKKLKEQFPGVVLFGLPWLLLSDGLFLIKHKKKHPIEKTGKRKKN